MSKFIKFPLVAVLAGLAILLFLNGRPADVPMDKMAGVTDASSFQALSGSGSFSLDIGKSQLSWEAKKPLLANYTDRGTLGLASGTLTLKDGAITDGIFMIDMNTLATISTGKGMGEDGLTKHLKSDSFFGVEKNPTAIFEITGIAPGNRETEYQVSGKLTIKGITNPVTFPAAIYQAGGMLKAKASVALDRTLWDIRFGSGKFFENLGNKVIDDMFTVQLDLAALKTVE